MTRISSILTLAVGWTAVLTNAAPTPLNVAAKSGSEEVLEIMAKRGLPPLRLASKTLLGTDMACAFAELFFGDENILETEQPTYEELRVRHWSQTAALHPGCIVKPTTPREVSIAVGIARLTNSKFAVRSGGHNASPGFANIDEGLLISMENLNEVSYNETAGNAVIGAGNRWGDVYRELDPYNVTVVGGRVPDVGVGGLILGGGLSYLSNRWGLAADNVENYEVVLSNGTIVNANREENTDLFWALKGGSNNFGIITRYTLKTIPLGNIWGGQAFYAPEDASKVIEAYSKYQQEGQKDKNSNILVQVSSDPIAGTFVNFFYEVPIEDEYPAVFADFFKIPIRYKNTQVWRYSAFLDTQAQAYDIPRWQLRGTSYKADADIDQAILDISRRDFGPLYGRVPYFATILIYQPVAPWTVEYSQKNGGNPMGIRKEYQTWFSTAAGWILPQNDTTIYNATKTVQLEVEKISKKEGKFLDFVFMNDAFRDQNPIETYPEKNQERMREIALKYDPQRLFKELVPGGFKVPEKKCASNCTVIVEKKIIRRPVRGGKDKSKRGWTERIVSRTKMLAKRCAGQA